MLPVLERRHDVLAPTLPGHAGGPSLGAELATEAVLDELERALDAAGFEQAHLVGNSLGGWAALQLAARGRARSVVALAPAGGWSADDESYRQLLVEQGELQAQLQAIAPLADEIVATEEGRRRATLLTAVRFEHIPPELLAHQLVGAARCDAETLIGLALREGWQLDAERIECPVRIVWGEADAVLPWPSAAARFRGEWLPHADWVVLEGVGHCPQLDVPREAAELVLGFTAP